MPCHIIPNATIELRIPSQLEVTGYELASDPVGGRTTVAIETNIILEDVVITFPDKRKLILKKLHLCELRGRLLPVYNQTTGYEMICDYVDAPLYVDAPPQKPEGGRLP